MLLTLSLASGGYVLAEAMAVSAPITAVCAGLLIGDIGAKHGMSETTRRYVDAFWKLIDEVLNAVLFLLIGFEVFAVGFGAGQLAAGAMAIGLSLLARLVSVLIPALLLRPLGAAARRHGAGDDLGRAEGRHLGGAGVVACPSARSSR